MLVNIFMLLLFWPFSYSLMQFPPSILKLSTQHPPYFFKLSTQHQPAITRIESWTILPTQGLHFSYTLIRTFSKISAYTKTVQFYSTKNTTMNKFLAQCSSPCLMLGGIPPASLSEGWVLYPRGPAMLPFNATPIPEHGPFIRAVPMMSEPIHVSHDVYTVTGRKLLRNFTQTSSVDDLDSQRKSISHIAISVADYIIDRLLPRRKKNKEIPRDAQY